VSRSVCVLYNDPKDAEAAFHSLEQHPVVKRATHAAIHSRVVPPVGAAWKRPRVRTGALIGAIIAAVIGALALSAAAFAGVLAITIPLAAFGGAFVGALYGALLGALAGATDDLGGSRTATPPWLLPGKAAVVVQFRDPDDADEAHALLRRCPGALQGSPGALQGSPSPA
jgi:hypothetical protein